LHRLLCFCARGLGHINLADELHSVYRSFEGEKLSVKDKTLVEKKLQELKK